ncbi:hypothetical protein WM43_08870 [Aeromonas veronii]|uniref:Uncharacterized protein n=1 Tax=Aeromonas veronii TaxID=654 RepID=A0AAC9B6U6_AERVE|nr:hypothetical protein WM43_08870 [Aeromonas veronii]KZW97325.1 hypothetical protein WM54_04220 [Aeromonas veronii]
MAGMQPAISLARGILFSPSRSGYSIPEAEAGLILPLANEGDLTLISFQPDIPEQGGRQIDLHETTLDSGNPSLDQGFNTAQ